MDFAAANLEQLDVATQELNISCQTLIKILIRQALDQRGLACRARQ